MAGLANSLALSASEATSGKIDYAPPLPALVEGSTGFDKRSFENFIVDKLIFCAGCGDDAKTRCARAGMNA